MSNSTEELTLGYLTRWILSLLQSLFDYLLTFEWVMSSGCPEYCILFCKSRDQGVESVPSREGGDPAGFLQQLGLVLFLGQAGGVHEV